MRLLDRVEVGGDSRRRFIELYAGDLTSMSPEGSVDVLVVSAFPDDYLPFPGSLIGGLAEKGVSVEKLARDKEVDLRETCSCWLSKRIEVDDPGIQFNRLLCFEPHTRGHPPEVVGDIFRSLIPFLGSGVGSVAMPIVSTGIAPRGAGVPVAEMLPPLVEAAMHWMSVGAPLDRLKIVIRPGEREGTILDLFRHITREAMHPSMGSAALRYDVFVSYARENAREVDLVVGELRRLGDDLVVYLDRQELNPGSAWQQELFEALDASRRVVTVYSPEYVRSKVCKEEFNIAWARSRDTESPLLFPLYLYSTDLPTYMKMVQFADCREGNTDLLREAASQLVSEIRADRPAHSPEARAEPVEVGSMPVAPLSEKAAESVESPPIRIVISYRREDPAGGVHRLRESLARHFGAENVLFDIDSIPPGVDWAEAVRRSVSECDVLLPAIGPHWLTVTDERGQRRLDNENDVVRFEIETALETGVRVIPILFAGACMPHRAELPPSLSGLTWRQAIQIDDDWEHDVANLIRALEAVQQEKAEVAPAERAERERPARAARVQSPAPAQDDVERMAELEHERWMEERIADGWRHSPARDDDQKLHPYLVPWSELSEGDKEITRQLVQTRPAAPPPTRAAEPPRRRWPFRRTARS